MSRGVLRHPLRGRYDSAAAHAALLGDRRDSAWLDGGGDGWSYLAVGRPWIPPEPVLPAIAARLSALAVSPHAGGRPERDERDAPRFAGGLIGWLSYELRGETTGAAVPRRGRHPLAAFLEVDRVVAVHADGRAELLALGEGWTGELATWRDATVDALRHAPEPGSTAASAPVPAAVPAGGGWRDGEERYLDLIADCQRAIRAGDAYQLCLTTSFSVPHAGARPDAVALHRRLRASSPSHHGGLLRIAGVDLISSSPERFLTVRPDGRVESSPIKGTRPRAADPVADERAAAELAASEKETAENLMIVDLVRNDLSRVCTPESVEVTALNVVERYAQVHQLVSTVRGRLAPGRTGLDAVAACFPAGSMTGAPKRRATELLDGWERQPRGLYAGAFGWFGADGDVELAMTIRSIVVDDVAATVGTGGGITALSDPADELAETRVKAAPLLAALGIRP